MAVLRLSDLTVFHVPALSHSSAGTNLQSALPGMVHQQKTPASRGLFC